MPPLMTRFNEFYSISSQPHHYLMILYFLSFFLHCELTTAIRGLIAIVPEIVFWLKQDKTPSRSLNIQHFRSGHSNNLHLKQYVDSLEKGESKLKKYWKSLKWSLRFEIRHFENRKNKIQVSQNNNQTYLFEKAFIKLFIIFQFTTKKPSATIEFAVFTIIERDNIISTSNRNEKLNRRSLLIFQSREVMMTKI
jgi:hypothetical protein